MKRIGYVCYLLLFSQVAWGSCQNVNDASQLRECLDAESKVVEQKLAETYRAVLSQNSGNSKQYFQKSVYLTIYAPNQI